MTPQARYANGTTGWPEFHLTEPVRAVQINTAEDLESIDNEGLWLSGTHTAGDWYFVGMEGTFHADFGDYLVAGPDGGLCPIPRRTFERVYELGRGP